MIELEVVYEGNLNTQFKIVRQSDRCMKNKFEYKGVVYFDSCNYPEVRYGHYAPEVVTLFLWGDDEEKDDTVLTVSNSTFKWINEAVEAYNEQWKERFAKDKKVEICKQLRPLIYAIESVCGFTIKYIAKDPYSYNIIFSDGMLLRDLYAGWNLSSDTQNIFIASSDTMKYVFYGVHSCDSLICLKDVS